VLRVFDSTNGVYTCGFGLGEFSVKNVGFFFNDGKTATFKEKHRSVTDVMVIQHLHSRSLTARPGKMMVFEDDFPFGKDPF